jgi:hypothetical protein
VDSNSKCETFEGHVTSNTCLADAKEYDIVNVSGEETNDAQPVLSVVTKGWYQVLKVLETVVAVGWY